MVGYRGSWGSGVVWGGGGIGVVGSRARVKGVVGVKGWWGLGVVV